MKKNRKENKIINPEIERTILISIIIILVLFFTYLISEAFIKNNFSFKRESPTPQVSAEEIWFNENNYSTTSEIIATTTATTTETASSSPVDAISIITKEGQYVEVVDSCDAHFGGACVRARACPSTECPVVTSLRTGMVLKTDGEITEAEGIKWYHIVFDEWVRYSDRIAQEFYVSADYLKVIDSYKTRYAKDAKVENLTNKKIIVDRSEQKLYAYDGEELFMEVLVSTGLDDLPTPRGNFNIFEKTPSRYMQGPLPGISEQYYDLPGVPWTMYFTYQGGAIHGAYWHDKFGSQWSHGCVNLVPTDSEKLYDWADLGTTVIVRD